MTTTDSHTAALNSILQMCKECDPSTIRTLILRALSSPDIFCGFDQIKTQVQSSLGAVPDGQAILTTLDLFSYGTFKDASTTSNEILSLTDAQLHKLKLLTVLTLCERVCCEGNGILAYSTVAQELNLAVDTLETNRQVEELIIDCIYAGIVQGKLCQKTRSLIVSRVIPRDVQNVTSMLSSLKHLQENLVSTVVKMETDKANVEKRRQTEKEFLKKAAALSAKNTSGRAAASGGGTSRGPRDMAASMMRRQKRSRGGGGVLGDAFPRM